MTPQERTPKTHRSLATRLYLATAALVSLGLLAASPAAAAFEQVDTFAGTPGALKDFKEPWPEEVQLGGVGGMAVNYTGAGGVPKGTLYAGAIIFSEMRVARYNPDGSFSESWTFDEAPGFKERCGPEGDPAHPVCASRPSANAGGVDVDIDQSTGYVYSLVRGNVVPPGANLIHVYTPDGAELIAEFGEQAAGGETIATSPAKIHNTVANGGIAVNADGVVYVYDEDNGAHGRLMKFEPQSAGDYEHYVYAGQAHDVVLGEHVVTMTRPVADAAGDLYVARDSKIAKLDPDNLADPVLCEFKFPKASLDSITVDPLSGEVFFHSANTSISSKIFRLSPCDEASGKFEEAGTITFLPKRFDIGGLAFDPVRQFASNRPAGVLYAGAPEGAGGNTDEGPPFKEESSLGYVFAHPVEQPPEVLSESVSHVTATTAGLSARINPKGQPTRYAFQYLTQAEYEANEPADRFAGAKESPFGGALLGEGSATLSAGASLTGLAPDTTYHYRALATNHCSEEDPEKVCKGTGVDQSFRTFALESPGLPDNRVYELVSPPQKEGGQVLPADPRISSCGSRCKPGASYSQFPRQVSLDGDGVAYEGTPFSDEGAVIENEYLARRDPKTGWQSTNLTPPLLMRAPAGGAYYALDATLSRGLLGQVNPALNPEAPEGFADLYSQQSAEPLSSLKALLTEEPRNRTSEAFKLTYAGASKDLSRVFFAANDALTKETPFAPEAEDGGESKFNLYEWSEGRLSLVNVSPGNAEAKAGASLPAAGAHSISNDGSHVFFEDEANQVFVRIDGESTLQIPAPGKFLSAATDGSKVLLASGALYDLQTEGTTDLTEGKGGFQGVVGESEDLSHVYFVDTAVLSEEENAQHQKAQAGKFNLYAREEGGAARFVATLLATDNDGGNIARDWPGAPSNRTAEASPQGRYLAFQSTAPLSGYDSTGPCKPEGEKLLQVPCPEVFLYDSQSGQLTCPSCNPTGISPLGHSTLRLIGGINGSPPYLPQPRYLTDEGRLYFDSQDSLSPFDTNEGVEDVYQYEPSGAGSCKREAGCVSLLSAGTGTIDSNLLAVDQSGKNVFFTTREQLVLKDTDDLIDLYVAREDGGIPGETEVARSECQGEACVPALSPPNDPTPGSSSFEGAGNVDEKKAAKKHKKKKHAKKKAHKRAAKHNRGGSK